MAIVDISTELAAPADAVWRAVKTPAAFRTVTRGVLTMPVLKDRDDTWREGETVQGWVFLFGVVPFSRHQLHVADIDDADMTLRSQERGGPIRRWNHDIVVTPVDDSRCTYRDRIDIAAGGLTAVVVGYARWFYRIRQRRWCELAKTLAPEGQP
jgi:ligand-binding SRPBCC domain-containing protein